MRTPSVPTLSRRPRIGNGVPRDGMNADDRLGFRFNGSNDELGSREGDAPDLVWQGHTGRRRRQPVPPAEELLDEEDDELARFRK